MSFEDCIDLLNNDLSKLPGFMCLNVSAGLPELDVDVKARIIDSSRSTKLDISRCIDNWIQKCEPEWGIESAHNDGLIVDLRDYCSEIGDIPYGFFVCHLNFEFTGQR